MKIFAVAYTPITNHYVKVGDLVRFDSRLHEEAVKKELDNRGDSEFGMSDKEANRLWTTAQRNWFENKFKVWQDALGRVTSIEVPDENEPGDPIAVVTYGNNRKVRVKADDVVAVIPMKCKPYLNFIPKEKEQPTTKDFIKAFEDEDGSYYFQIVEAASELQYNFFVENVARNFGISYDFEYFTDDEINFYRVHYQIPLMQAIFTANDHAKKIDKLQHNLIDAANLMSVESRLEFKKKKEEVKQTPIVQQAAPKIENIKVDSPIMEEVSNAEQMLFSLINTESDWYFPVNKKELVALLATHTKIVSQSIEGLSGMEFNETLIDEITEETFRRMESYDIRNYFRKANRTPL